MRYVPLLVGDRGLQVRRRAASTRRPSTPASFSPVLRVGDQPWIAPPSSLFERPSTSYAPSPTYVFSAAWSLTPRASPRTSVAVERTQLLGRSPPCRATRRSAARSRTSPRRRAGRDRSIARSTGRSGTTSAELAPTPTSTPFQSSVVVLSTIAQPSSITLPFVADHHAVARLPRRRLGDVGQEHVGIAAAPPSRASSSGSCRRRPPFEGW